MNWQEQCIDLWGLERWKSTLALCCNCSKRAVQYWNTGQRTIPDDVKQMIYKTHKIWRT